MSRRKALVLTFILLAWPLTFPLAALADEIHEVIAEGDIAGVTRMLQEVPGLVNSQDTNQTRDLPLHTAAAHGQVEIATLLLKAGAAVDAGDADESTPLDVAAVRRQKEMVQYLLTQGADVNHRDINQAYSLSFAAFGGDEEIVQILLEAGADLNYENARGLTLLHAAASRGMQEFTLMLLERGTDINAATTNGETPLHWAARGGQTETVRLLIAKGADVAATTEDGQSPLFLAAFPGHVEVAKLLIDANADVDPVNRHGTTPLVATIWQGHIEFASLLLARGADPNRTNENGETALILATAEGNTEMVEAFLVAGAETSPRENHYGYTALHLAAVYGYADLINLLIAHTASVSPLNDADQTPLHLATCYGQKQAAKALLEAGASQDEIRHSGSVPGADYEVATGEAVVWYLGHSSWGIKTHGHFLVFDYWDQGRRCDDPGLCNGHIRPSEIAGLNVAVFATHEHRDHYDPLIFDWREEISDIVYILGCQPEGESLPAYEYIEPRQERLVDGLEITTIESNDTGVGFVIRVDGLVIFHAGDHANRQQDFSGPYRAEIDFLATAGVRPDLAFMPIRGCGFGDPEAVRLGVDYALEKLQPAVFIPMHAGHAGYHYQEFVDASAEKFPQVEMVAVRHRGDNFRYDKGNKVIGLAEF